MYSSSTTLSSRRAVAPSSPLAEAVARVGDRWLLLLVDAMLSGPARFGDLSEAIPGIAPNILSGRLKHLVAEGVAVARPYSRRPPRFEYALTERGRELGGALRLLAQWGAPHATEGEATRHEVCGTPVEPRWYCPTCDALTDGDASALTYV